MHADAAAAAVALAQMTATSSRWAQSLVGSKNEHSDIADSEPEPEPRFESATGFASACQLHTPQNSMGA